MKLYLILGVTEENVKQEERNYVELWAAESKEQLRDLIHPCEIPDSLIRDLRNIQPEGKHALNHFEAAFPISPKFSNSHHTSIRPCFSATHGIK